MDATEARRLLMEAFGEDAAAPEVRRLCRLWAGMGDVWELRVAGRTAVAKRIRMPRECSSLGDLRKRESYEVEARWYKNGYAERLLAAGCALPRPFLVKRGTDTLTILMSSLEGRPGAFGRGAMSAVPSKRPRSGTPRHPAGARWPLLSGREVAFPLRHAPPDAPVELGHSLRLEEMRSLLSWLAALHATFWGARADEAVRGGLQPQGTYWCAGDRRGQGSGTRHAT